MEGHTEIFDGGPFTFGTGWLAHLVYRIGFDREVDAALQPGFSYSTWETPKWVRSNGIVGTWKPFRQRLTWMGLPVTRWKYL